MERKLPNSKRREISFTRDWPSRGNKPRRIVVNRSKTRPWVVKNDTRENSARILRPGIIQDHIEWEQVPNGEGQRSMVTVIVSRWFVSRFQRFFMVKLWREIYRSECICKRICKLVCYGSRRSYFLFFIFFLLRQLTGATVSLLQVTM